jgi:hypothetical protein
MLACGRRVRSNQWPIELKQNRGRGSEPIRRLPLSSPGFGLS